MLRRARGFTLVELIVVIVITGVMAGGILIYFKPALTSYLAVGRRAGLTDLADGALRTVSRDIRRAVPNSLRLAPSSRCIELVPTSDGGRFRTAPDIVWDAANPSNPSAPMDMSNPVTSFDVMTTFSTQPAAGDWIVIGNQNGNDVYDDAKNTRAAIASIGAPPSATLGTRRITLTGPSQFPSGYDGGRFVVVPNAQQAVFYVCDKVGTDAKGSGTGTLYRFSGYGFIDAAPTSCPTPAETTPVLATKVSACTFIYSPNAGATQESGFLQAQITLSEEGESVSLSSGVHVENVP